MNELTKEEKVFKDPLHKYIYVQDQLIWDLINTKEFQRLRRIRQLGTSYVTFHGSEHSRFSHSLGVYEVARQMISLFERNSYPDWPRGERLLCLCAALLHDIGHGPFSHSFETVFGMDHENWTRAFITGNTEVNEVLRRVSTEFPKRVAQVIEKKYENDIVVRLVSSQLDADRMDYLLRDSTSTGVSYGMFDLDRILRVARPYRGHLVVKESGMHAVEDYLMARYQMYWQVYFHPVTKSSEILLRNILRRAKLLHQQNYQLSMLTPALTRLFEQNLSVSDYFELDEAIIQAVFMQWTKEEDAILSDLCKRFMHRRLFKYSELEDDGDPLIDKVRERLRYLGLPEEYYMAVDLPSDLPYDIYQPGESEESSPIYLLDHQEQLVEISQRSVVVRSISGIHQGRHYLYYPDECGSIV